MSSEQPLFSSVVLVTFSGSNFDECLPQNPLALEKTLSITSFRRGAQWRWLTNISKRVERLVLIN